jgi:hypothetical protein
MWRTAAQFRNIRVVHGKDQIKIFEIAGQYASGALPGNVDAVGACGCNRAAVRQFALMPAAETGGIDVDCIIKACSSHDALKIPSASGERQILPMQTKRMLIRFIWEPYGRMKGAWHETGKAGKGGHH